MLYAIDVSKWQGTMDWRTVKKAGISHAMLRALWGLAHTKDPARAKPWAAPNGQSGMYMKGECYLAKDGTVKRCLQDNCVWDAAGLPSAWEEVQI